jgi:hypothetical protein
MVCFSGFASLDGILKRQQYVCCGNFTVAGVCGLLDMNRYS